jgi:hypothetical protein
MNNSFGYRFLASHPCGELAENTHDWPGPFWLNSAMLAVYP